MILKTSFEDFLGQISLDKTRREKIQSAHNAVRAILELDQHVKAIYLETFLQGSYRLWTAVRPQGEALYDVDVVLSLNLMDFEGHNRGLPSPKVVLEWLAARLRSYPAYKDKVKVKARCIRLMYSDGFCMDIIPAHCSGDLDAPLRVPISWQFSHPKGFKAYCVNTQQTSGEMFYPIVKILKWWRNIHFGDEGSPKSILLTTMAGQNIPSVTQTIDEALVLTMESLNKYLANNFFVPDVYNPSLKTEKLSANWTWEDYQEFKTKFSSATKLARKALDADEEEKSIELWNSDDLFMGTFPKALNGLENEAVKCANAMREGSLFTSPSGLLTTVPLTSSIAIPATKYYGE